MEARVTWVGENYVFIDSSDMPDGMNCDDSLGARGSPIASTTVTLRCTMSSQSSSTSYTFDVFQSAIGDSFNDYDYELLIDDVVVDLLTGRE